MLQVGKHKQVLKGKKFKDLSQWPLALSAPEHQLKVFAVMSNDADKFLLNVNGQPYPKFPYMNAPVDPFKKSEILLDAKVTINDSPVKVSIPWNVIDTCANIMNKVGENPSEYHVSIAPKQQFVKCDTPTINELIDLIVSVYNKDIGMSVFELQKLPPASEQQICFDNDVLERVVKRCHNLRELRIERMSEVYEIARKQLIKMSIKIFECTQNNLTELSLFKLSDQVSEGEEILNYLANSKIKSL